MAPRKTCPVCGSKQWHKEAHSGMIACSQGHILQDYRKETRDAYDVGAAGLRKRTVKQQRKQKQKDKSKADTNILHGQQGRYHYFRCLQLLLRKQIYALMRIWKLPSAFEIICRDIWALHLSLLPEPVPSERYLSAQEESLGKLEEEEDPSSPSSSELDEDELQELLGENSSDEGVDDSGSKVKSAADGSRSRRRRPGNELQETLLGNLAVLVVACWTLRIPVLYRDFRTIIESYEIPYLDATVQLPHEMRIHLSKARIQSLSPSHAPSTLLLHGVSARLARHLFSKFGVFTPEVNAAHILWRTVKAMGGNEALYCLVKRISHALSLPLTLSPSLAPRLSTLTSRDPVEHICDNAPPELAFVATITIGLKMVYGLDGLEREPREQEDLACNMLCRQDYKLLVQHLMKQASVTQEQLFSSETPLHVGELDDVSLDKYLDLCEKALLGNKERVSTIPELDTLEQYFPLVIGADSVSLDSKRPEEGTKPDSRPIEAREGSRRLPGQKYRVYFGDDLGGEVEPEYELVLRRAAGWVCVDVEDLHPIIEVFERRLLRWWRREGRRKGETPEGSSGED